jgi:hypothetical protein
MDEVKREVANLLRVLEARQKIAIELVDTVHQLQNYLDEESKFIVWEGLDRLLSTVRTEAAGITGGTIVVLISPEWIITVDKIYGKVDTDFYLRRLRSQGYYTLTLPEFSYSIHQLKYKIAEGDLIPIIEFLKANAKVEMPRTYQDISSSSTTGQLHEPSTLSQWKPSDFLPAPFPHLPVPRWFFKD